MIPHNCVVLGVLGDSGIERREDPGPELCPSARQQLEAAQGEITIGARYRLEWKQQ